MNSLGPPFEKLKDDNNNNNSHKNIAMQMERQPLSHHLIQRINQHTSLSNHHNVRIRSPPQNALNHTLHPNDDRAHSQEANDVKGHRTFRNISRPDRAVDDQMSCSPLSMSGDDQVNLGLGKEHTSPVVGRKRRKHSGPQVRPTCNECGKDFSNQSALSKHKLTHSDVRKFSCEVCEKAFKRQDHLNGHMLTHREKKPYECDVEGCEKTYCDARSLRRHKENHHVSINVMTSSHPAVGHTNNVASSALRSLLSGHANNLFSQHNLATSDHNPFTQGYLGDGHSSVSGNQIASNRTSHPLDMPANQSFPHGYSYPNAVGNDEMPSPHPPPFHQFRRTAPIQAQHPPPPIVLNQSNYNSHSVPTTPTTIHPQTPVSAEPLPSPHHLSVNNGNQYGSLNGHQHSHPCTPTQPVNTFSFSPHQVQQYHQQQQEQNQNGARSLPTTPTEPQNSPITPAVGYMNEGNHHYQQSVYQQSEMHHGPRSLPATPADHHVGMSYSVHHQAHTYNDPNPSPYSVASQSSPYDLHQPVSHLQNQQSNNNSSYQTHHEPRQQLHSTGTYEDHDMSETYQESTAQYEADIDVSDISPIDVQNLMEQIQNHQTSSGQPLQHQQLQSMESHQGFYPQTEPITPTTPATPTPFHSFPIPNKFQAHNFRSNVIHQNQDTLTRQAFPHPISSGKSMSLIVNTQQQHVDHQQQMLQVESVNHRQDVTNAQHHNPDQVDAFQVPTLVNRSFPSRTAMDLKQNSSMNSVPPVQNNSANQNFGSTSHIISFRDELRSTTPPNLVVNLSPMTSRPPSTAVSSSITIADEDSLQNHVAKTCANNTRVINEEEDDVFSKTVDDIASDDTLVKMKELSRNEKLIVAETNPNHKEVCHSNQLFGASVKNLPNLKRSHATGGVIVHGADQNVRQQNVVQSSNLLLLQALQKAQQFEKGSNGNKKPCENNKVVELQSPKRMRHKPEPIYIPPQVNAFGVNNTFSSRISRSPRIWDGKGSHMSSSVNHSAFTKLTFNQGPLDNMSKISPPPYTPPPMLSPVRTSFGYYYHINLNASGTPKIPLASSSFGTSFSRKFSLFPVTKDGHTTVSKPETFDSLKDREQLEVQTPMTAYEPFPEFSASFDSEKSSEGDILPHVNIGLNYQARIPAFISDKESAKEKYRHEKADIVWDPSILQNNLKEEDIISFLEVSCSQCVPGSGRNQEYAHHLLYRAKGDLQEALIMLLEPKPKIKEFDPLYGYHYSETDLWSTEDISAYHQALIKCDKDFLAISKDVRNKTVKECIQFYYLWKKVCPEEYRKLRIIRRKREQEGFYAKSVPPPILEVEQEAPIDDASRSCSPILAGSLTCPDSDGSSMTGFDSMNPSPAASSTGSIINNNNQGESSGFPCKLCGKVFNKIKSRSAHMKIHSSGGKDISN